MNEKRETTLDENMEANLQNALIIAGRMLEKEPEGVGKGTICIIYNLILSAQQQLENLEAYRVGYKKAVDALKTNMDRIADNIQGEAK